MDSSKDTPSKLRAIINCNAPWSTSGYANQLLELMPYLKKDIDLAINCFYGLEGGVLNINGVRMYPKMASMWGEDALLHHGKDWGANVYFTLQDIWVLNDQTMSQINPWVPIVPIDHDPVPEIIVQKLKMAYRVVTYSKFGHKQLLNRGIHSTYIPHSVNTDLFNIPKDKGEAKKGINLDPKMFVVGVVADNKENPSRKSFQEILEAFAMFLRREPNSVLYFHSVVNKEGGFHIPQYAQKLGIADKIYHPDVYTMLFKTDKKKMGEIMGAFDVLLSPSTNEGFGVPIIEAQACGVPVITNKFTSMAELVVPNQTGLFCDISHKRFTPIGSYVAMPDAKSIYRSMMRLKKTNREKLAPLCRKHIYDNYRTEFVYDHYWRPFLAKLYEELVEPFKELAKSK